MSSSLPRSQSKVLEYKEEGKDEEQLLSREVLQLTRHYQGEVKQCLDERMRELLSVRQTIIYLQSNTRETPQSVFGDQPHVPRETLTDGSKPLRSSASVSSAMQWQNSQSMGAARGWSADLTMLSTPTASHGQVGQKRSRRRRFALLRRLGRRLSDLVGRSRPNSFTCTDVSMTTRRAGGYSHPSLEADQLLLRDRSLSRRIDDAKQCLRRLEEAEIGVLGTTHVQKGCGQGRGGNLGEYERLVQQEVQRNYEEAILALGNYEMRIAGE